MNMTDVYNYLNIIIKSEMFYQIYIWFFVAVILSGTVSIIRRMIFGG